jgi:hypothetical protein
MCITPDVWEPKELARGYFQPISAESQQAQNAMHCRPPE